MIKKIQSAEAVGIGHPDKLCDQISDAILDAYLRIDPNSHVAIDVTICDNLVQIIGNVTFNAKGRSVDYQEITKDIFKEAGYNSDNLEFKIKILKQDVNINKAVTKANGDIGAGDQGIVYGYATNETEEYMPLSFVLANKILKYAEQLRKQKEFRWALSDMKCLVILESPHHYTKFLVKKIVVSIAHSANYEPLRFRKFIKNNIIKPVLEPYVLNKTLTINNDTEYFINSGGDFENGGASIDTGLTGRKIIVDSYGGGIPHGGGAYSGKDATKVDRSGAYLARFIAKNLVAARLCTKVLITIHYAIGLKEPLNISFDTFGTATPHQRKIISDLIKLKSFANSIEHTINSFKLYKPIYKDTATYGHFGKPYYTWEQIHPHLQKFIEVVASGLQISKKTTKII